MENTNNKTPFDYAKQRFYKQCDKKIYELNTM